ncbi:M48 family metallopeptidase [Streptomonospora nanhaiensis]|uniref:Zn-dependent protease with chaperone function n=1 Tax=Streptomonospora nanhaiensis TaxID=1323731 RepID=A0A853BUT2_9ACTN|nr:M48 family metallopeptidase [Streptomonospora nanhaiensis]MBV2363505.1 M48 family metallopeptidase [Streptomonospora nanhaiensis]MBX9390290.1 M48 family metallopeptidase [Streptomonospora nanhaiensis]NYI98515.1 Zn-dependent protease with chaperone function [Streptomonospora nanhaiensis]
MATNAPDRARVRLENISSRAYEHPADRGALVALRSLRGFDEVFKRLSGLFNERALRLMFLSSSVRVNEQQFPEVHNYVRDAAYILDLDEVPELYIQMNPRPNAMAIGSHKPFIVMTTGLFDLLDAEEQRFVVGHEVGHILSGHAVYRTMLLALIRLAARVAWIPLGYIGIRAIVTALEEWYRKSELSCDRAGVLAGQNPDAAKRALMKLAGGSRLAEMNPDSFMEQAREYERGGDARDSLIKLLSLMGQTHPFAVMRMAELTRWLDNGDYQRILNGDYPRRDTDRSANVGEEARNAANSYREAWERSEDPLLGTLRDVAGSAASAGGRIFDTVADRWKNAGNRRTDSNAGSASS